MLQRMHEPVPSADMATGPYLETRSAEDGKLYRLVAAQGAITAYVHNRAFGAWEPVSIIPRDMRAFASRMSATPQENRFTEGRSILSFNQKNWIGNKMAKDYYGR